MTTHNTLYRLPHDYEGVCFFHHEADAVPAAYRKAAPHTDHEALSDTHPLSLITLNRTLGHAWQEAEHPVGRQLHRVGEGAHANQAYQVSEVGIGALFSGPAPLQSATHDAATGARAYELPHLAGYALDPTQPSVLQLMLPGAPPARAVLDPKPYGAGTYSFYHAGHAVVSVDVAKRYDAATQASAYVLQGGQYQVLGAPHGIRYETQRIGQSASVLRDRVSTVLDEVEAALNDAAAAHNYDSDGRLFQVPEGDANAALVAAVRRDLTTALTAIEKYKRQRKRFERRAQADYKRQKTRQRRLKMRNKARGMRVKMPKIERASLGKEHTQRYKALLKRYKGMRAAFGRLKKLEKSERRLEELEEKERRLEEKELERERRDEARERKRAREASKASRKDDEAVEKAEKRDSERQRKAADRERKAREQARKNEAKAQKQEQKDVKKDEKEAAKRAAQASTRPTTPTAAGEEEKDETPAERQQRERMRELDAADEDLRPIRLDKEESDDEAVLDAVRRARDEGRTLIVNMALGAV